MMMLMLLLQVPVGVRMASLAISALVRIICLSLERRLLRRLVGQAQSNVVSRTTHIRMAPNVKVAGVPQGGGQVQAGDKNGGRSEQMVYRSILQEMQAVLCDDQRGSNQLMHVSIAMAIVTTWSGMHNAIYNYL